MRAAPLLISVAGLAALIGAPVAVAAPVPVVGLNIDRSFDEAGDPVLVGNYAYVSPGTTPAWQRCVGDLCEETGVANQLFQPGPTAPGVRFQATGSYDGRPATALTPEWGGRVTNVTPPTLSGEIKVGAPLTATGGAWSGGWPDDYSELQIRACRTAAGEGCVQVAYGSPATLNAAYAGWYVGAVELRYGTGTAFPAVGLLFPADAVSRNAAQPPSQTVAVGALSGPVPTPPGQPTPPASPKGGTNRPITTAPVLALRKAALLTRGSLVVGTVRCPNGCVASVHVQQGKRTATRKVKVKPGMKTKIGVSARRFDRTRKLRVTVRFDDSTPPLTGTLRARR